MPLYFGEEMKTAEEIVDEIKRKIEKSRKRFQDTKGIFHEMELVVLVCLQDWIETDE
jgi:hypothetical protein